MSDDTPIYNLKAVMKEVGLSASTLRAWEQRYGVPQPHRTAGGHRLYSRQDVEMLKWLVERQREGLSISQAVEMWKEHNLTEQRMAIHSTVPQTEMSASASMLDALRDQWITACLEYDDQTANRVLDQSFAIATPETICTEVLQKGLSNIGDGWYAANVSVQQEHFTTAIAVRRINTLLASVAPPTRTGRILAVCPPGETHDFILLLVSYLLRRRGWDVVYLGPNVPLQDLDAAIDSTRPILVLSAAQTLISAARLRTTSEYLARNGISLVFGGGVFDRVPSTIKCISGYYLGNDIPSVASIIERLVQTQPSMPVVQPISANYSQALGRFLQNEAFIVSYVETTMRATPIEPAHLQIATENLTQLIYSALILGDIDLLDSSIAWLNGLLNNYHISPNLIDQFYIIYRQAAERYLGSDASLIRDWLGKQLVAKESSKPTLG